MVLAHLSGLALTQRKHFDFPFGHQHGMFSAQSSQPSQIISVLHFLLQGFQGKSEFLFSPFHHADLFIGPQYSPGTAQQPSLFGQEEELRQVISVEKDDENLVFLRRPLPMGRCNFIND